jgi:hypothetical protein
MYGAGLFTLSSEGLRLAPIPAFGLVDSCSKTTLLNPRQNEEFNLRNQRYLRWLLRPHQRNRSRAGTF